jgi:hypothetical protein
LENLKRRDQLGDLDTYRGENIKMKLNAVYELFVWIRVTQEGRATAF